jgi:RNA polymerase subunit RPABC4/transcription elongation factor Spt4
MHCFNCGALLVDDAAFCHKCGRPQRAQGRQEPWHWKFCEIVAKSEE